MKVSKQHGFTLIETVVSLLLLAVMSIMSYQAVEVVLNANQRSQTDLAEEARLQLTWQIIGNDLLHIRPRVFADGLGGIEPAYITQRYGALVSFTRGGSPLLVSNPSGLSRIRYELNDNDELLRHSLPAFLNPREGEQRAQLLLHGVSQVRFEQLSQEDYFIPNWPPLNLENSPLLLPRMIQVSITLLDGTSTSRLFPGVESDGAEESLNNGDSGETGESTGGEQSDA